MRTLRNAAVFTLLNALISMPYALAVDQTGQDFPKSFTCKPVEFYSGGFDFYQVKKAEHSGEPQFVGLRYWQKTTPHGGEKGKPVLRETLALEITSGEMDSVKFSGFESSLGKTDDLVLSAGWDGTPVFITSELFINDMTVRDGRCLKDF
jgi:hypothetical protein